MKMLNRVVKMSAVKSLSWRVVFLEEWPKGMKGQSWYSLSIIKCQEREIEVYNGVSRQTFSVGDVWA
jgi:hypothetical protein